MIQKKLVFIVVVFGLLVSGGFSAVSGAGQWKFYGCCYIQAYTECRGPKYFPDQASCLRYAGAGVAECAAGAAEYKTTYRVTGGCTFVPDEDEKTKCLDSCADFYVCSWENNMCVKRIAGDDTFSNPNSLGGTTLKATGTTLRSTATTLRTTATTLRSTATTIGATATTVGTPTTVGGVTATTVGSTVTTVKTTPATLRPYEKKPYVEESKYCGPEGNKLVMALIPRGPPGSGADFNTGCYNHDECYGGCASTGASKEFCDQQFSKDLKQVCQTNFQSDQNNCLQKSWLNPLKYVCLSTMVWSTTYCETGAEIYYQAVSKLANCFDAYPCNVRKISWMPCT